MREKKRKNDVELLTDRRSRRERSIVNLTRLNIVRSITFREPAKLVHSARDRKFQLYLGYRGIQRGPLRRDGENIAAFDQNSRAIRKSR